jgi:hypothetical protein
LQRVLEEAGSHRLQQRRILSTARVSAHGFDQAVWLALAEGLGFSENREAFATLARAVPIQHLLPLTDSYLRASQFPRVGVERVSSDPTPVCVNDA